MTDEWRASDDMFGAFLAGVNPDGFEGLELNLFRHHRFLLLVGEETT